MIPVDEGNFNNQKAFYKGELLLLEDILDTARKKMSRKRRRLVVRRWRLRKRRGWLPKGILQNICDSVLYAFCL